VAEKFFQKIEKFSIFLNHQGRHQAETSSIAEGLQRLASGNIICLLNFACCASGSPENSQALHSGLSFRYQQSLFQ
jgi:hypothetical protein